MPNSVRGQLATGVVAQQQQHPQQQRIIATTNNILTTGVGDAIVGTPTLTFPSLSSANEFMARFKMEPGIVTTSATIVSGVGTMPCSATTTSGGGGGTTNHMIISNSNSLVSTSGNQVTGIPSLSLGPIDCYEDMFKEITKKLYGEEGIPDVIDAGATTTTVSNQSIVLDQDLFRTDGTGLTFVTTTANGLPPGTIVLQKRVTDDKGRRLFKS